MGTWLETKSTGSRGHGFGGLGDTIPSAPASPPGSARRSMRAPRKTRVSTTKLGMDEAAIISLEEAFRAHSAAFDLDGDGTICVEELILIFDRCSLFDDFFTPSRVRNYFTTWADGCNHVHGLTEPLGDDGIGFSDFKDVLSWAADMKSVDFATCVQRVVRLSRKLCDKAASVQRKLEVVFDAFCKKNPNHMSAFEFVNLCRTIKFPLSTGNVFSLFGHLPGGVQGKGLDFEGFIKVLGEVGQRLDIGDEVFPTFAKAVEYLDTDEETIIRVKMRLKHAATIVGGSSWQNFFKDCDPDRSGLLDWDEFVTMCRTKLHLADRDNHLRILFERLDEDASGELSIEELIAFIAT